MRLSALYLTALLACVAFLRLPQATAEEESSTDHQPAVLRITPGGVDVEPSKQIVVEFNRQMVPLGRMAADADELPISIRPALNCQWRWLNPTTLSCLLGGDSEMARATRYEVIVRDSFESFDGKNLAEEIKHSFITARPKVSYSYLNTWRAPTHPVYLMVFDQEVEQESVAMNVSWRPSGHLPVAAIARPATQYPGRGFLLEPAEELPEDTDVELMVSSGIRSLEGPEVGAEYRILDVFRTFAEFRFIGLQCTGEDLKPIHIGLVHSESEKACDPLRQVELRFNAPVIKEGIAPHLEVSPDIRGGREDYNPWDNVYSYSRLSFPNYAGSEYGVELPEKLKAETIYTISASGIEDEFGRRLSKPIKDFSFKTLPRRPELSLFYPFAVLEQGVDSDLPALVTNLQKIFLNFDVLTTDGVKRGRTASLNPYSVRNVAYHFPLGVRDYLGGRSGVVSGVAKSDPPGTENDGAKFFASITPFHVHVKLGHHSSLVWVTSFADGEPVKGASVRIYEDKPGFVDRPQYAARVVTGEDGTAVLPGLSQLDPEQKIMQRRDWGVGLDEPHFMVRVEHGKEAAFFPLVRELLEYPRDTGGGYIWVDLRERYGHLKAWGTTPQGIYKAGDTIQFKIYVRDQNDHRFIPAPTKNYTLTVKDPLDNVVYSASELTLNSFGSVSGEFNVPQNGAVGWYRFYLKGDFSERTLEPFQVLVSDFTPAPFKVHTETDKKLYRSGDKVSVTTEARLHAGGPFGNAKGKVSVQIIPESISAREDTYRAFYFSSPNRDPLTITRQELTLDGRGESEMTVELGEPTVLYGTLLTESAVKDDRGKSVAGRSSAKFFGRDRFVGVHHDGWVLETGKEEKLSALVIDEQGEPVAGAPLKLTVEYEKITAARVKGAGNAYLTRYSKEWLEEAECSEVSGEGPVSCVFTPKNPGTYRLRATIKDSKGRIHQSSITRWAVGPGQMLWESTNDNGLEVILEKDRYSVGETARALIKNPYPGASALITIERYGVQESRVEKLEGNTPLIEFEVKPEHLPGAYLSVVVMSPRTEQPLGPNLLDLGKPAFKMGYAVVKVNDSAKQLQITAKPEKDTYKPRERVRVRLHAETSDGKVPETEFAVAVLDEAVLDLLAKGKEQFDPYEGFYSVGDLDLLNFNIIKRLVGRIKFEKKGANPGGAGEGAALQMRSLFKFVSYWNPSIVADKEGNATIDFEAPDNLTGWRILALAVSKGDLMGLGDARYVVNQEIELRPSLPNQVTAGDKFDAVFTLLNRTERQRKLKVNVSADGLLAQPAAKEEQITLAPFARHRVILPVETSAAGKVRFEVTAGDETNKDGLSAEVPVLEREVEETAAVFGSVSNGRQETEVKVPDDAFAEKSKISITVSPSVLSNLRGPLSYLKEYPYSCWEQKLSRAVGASQYTALQRYLPADFNWPDAETFTEEILKEAAGFQGPNGGMTYYLAQEEYEDPYLSAYTALAFTWLKESGYEVPRTVEAGLHKYLEDFLRNDFGPTYYQDQLRAVVRAVALAALARSGKVTVDDIKRFEPHVAKMSLFGQAHFYLAAVEVEGAEGVANVVMERLRSSSIESGGKLVVNEPAEVFRDKAYRRILTSELRTTCAVLSAQLRAEQSDVNASAEAFKYVRSIVETRKARDHWQNTQENVFCTNALRSYAEMYESETPNLKATTLLDNKVFGRAELNDFRDSPRSFVRSLRKGDLGKSFPATILSEGPGRLHYRTAVTMVGEPETEAANAGIEVKREYHVERDGKLKLLSSPQDVRVGELLRVNLFVSVPTARNFVVVTDPLGGGFEPVNRDLATASTFDDDWSGAYPSDSYYHKVPSWSGFGHSVYGFYHRELRHTEARFYSEYLSPGNYLLSYTVQAIAAGEFSVMPTFAEEMYDPDVFGRGVPATLRITPLQDD